MNFILIKEILGISIIISVLHFLALKLFLYWTIFWFDIPMHFLGGFLIGLIIISILSSIFLKQSVNTLDKKLIFSFVIVGVLAVGLGWELWEIFIGFTNVIKDKQDTIIDLIMDFIGALGAISYYYFKYMD